MSITVNSLSNTGYRHTIKVDGLHELFTDMPAAHGGEGSAPEPHDLFDAALGACKALTVTQCARGHNIPLSGISVEVRRDDSKEKEGFYGMSVQLTLHGELSDEQRAKLLAIADKCPLHKLMTRVEVTIETSLKQGVAAE